MKKRISALFFALVLCLGMSTPILAEGGGGFTELYYRFVDMAGLLSESEQSDINATLDELSVRQSFDVIIVTTDDNEGYTSLDYATIVYEQFEYGYGEDADGVLLLVNMQDRDWQIIAHGYGMTVFTNDGIDYIGERLRPYLSNGEYAACFMEYARLCDSFITQAKTGEPFDNGNLPRDSFSPIWIPIALIVGFVIAKIIVGNMKGKLKSVRSQASADSYIKQGSMNITESRDLFLYHTVTRTVKSNNNDSSSSGTHTSSSGSTYRAGGGKF